MCIVGCRNVILRVGGGAGGEGPGTEALAGGRVPGPATKPVGQLGITKGCLAKHFLQKLYNLLRETAPVLTSVNMSKSILVLAHSFVLP